MQERKEDLGIQRDADQSAAVCLFSPVPKSWHLCFVKGWKLIRSSTAQFDLGGPGSSHTLTFSSVESSADYISAKMQQQLCLNSINTQTHNLPYLSTNTCWATWWLLLMLVFGEGFQQSSPSLRTFRCGYSLARIKKKKYPQRRNKASFYNWSIWKHPYLYMCARLYTFFWTYTVLGCNVSLFYF